MHKVLDRVRDAISYVDEMFYLHYGLEHAHIYLSFLLGNAFLVTWVFSIKLALT